MKVVGYSDRVGAEPGARVHVMVSSEAPAIHVTVARLLSDAAPSPAHVVPSATAGWHASGRQELRPGSYVSVPGVAAELATESGMTVCTWAWPTRRAAGEQALISAGDWTLALTDEGRLRFAITDAAGDVHELLTEKALRERVWSFVAAGVDLRRGRIQLLVDPQLAWAAPSRSEIVERTELSGAVAATQLGGDDAPLLIAGAWRRDESGQRVARTFNGKIAAPRVLGRALELDALIAERDRTDASGAGRDVVAAWDFSYDAASRRVRDVSGNGWHGETVQMPARGATGPRWTHDVACSQERPERYDAIHFHDDDLDDAGWTPTVKWDVPDDCPSGVYAVRLEDGAGCRDHVPIVVRPRRGKATSQILLVLPLFSYLAYANAHYSAAGEATGAADRFIHEHGLNSTYDRHADGSGVLYASWRRPLVSLRAGYAIHGRVPHGLSADLDLVAWLHHRGHVVDVVTDADVDAEGGDLLDRYAVVLSGSHAEYWSAAMLDALDGYLGDGGRYMYLSGNGLYWVTGVDAERGHTIEVRRCGAATARWHTEPGETRLSTTGEPGGLWRWRGRAPQRYVGVGFSAAPSAAGAVGVPYAREPASHDPRARFIFAGVASDEAIGDFPNRVFQHGAAGVEVDRADRALGTPAHALRLATASAFAHDTWAPAIEETRDPDVRADMVFFETPGGGAVFSAGSISWCGALSHNAYDNNVARITGNVLDRFLRPEPFELPTCA